ncbi:DgyrCDS12755 [Dimorphilus gyrociliatus]|uniref:Hydroxylysine kinase n=1 Tax=Dimorphilus gyrociliatus TaxID=2664684 RepID=A0A7I8W7E7_9ANNE|nr:DgyrCDS12755 [Dimorphilus gyrociliatus]
MADENGELNGGKNISEMSSIELAMNYKKKLSKRLKNMEEESNQDGEEETKSLKQEDLPSKIQAEKVKDEDPPAKPQVTKKRQRKKPRKRKSSYLLPEEVEARAVVERLKKRPQKKPVPTVRINGSIKNPLSLEICQKTSDIKIERPLKEYDNMTPYACTFCQNRILEEIAQYQDVLYGPYRVKDKEIWFHDECIVWATGVFLLDNGKMFKGEEAKPTLSDEEAGELLQELYGIVEAKLDPLSSFDDCNFRVSNGKLTKESHLSYFKESGYVLKVMNTLNSLNLDHIDGGHQVMIELLKHGMNVPEPITQKTGSYYCLKNINGNIHAVYLLTYLVGDLMESSVCTEKLAYSCGATLSHFHLLLVDLKNKGIETAGRPWSLSNLEKMRSYLDFVDDLEEKKMLRFIHDIFMEKVKSIEDMLPHGVTHGDFNDHNIICKNDEIVGVFDFGECARERLVYDLAICMFYVMIGSKRNEIKDWLKFGKHVINGYQSNRRLEELEKKVLSYCVLARFFQSFAEYWRLLKTNRLDSYTFTITHREAIPKLKDILELGIDATEKLWFDHKNIQMENIQSAKPIVDHNVVKNLLESLYDLALLSIQNLDSQCDCNFKVFVERKETSARNGKTSRDGYIFKILNTVDSELSDHIEGEHIMMHELEKHGISAPKPIPQVTGKLWSIETINSKKHLVRLLTFLPGTLLKDVSFTDNLANNCGTYLATIQNILRNINHEGLESYERAWSLSFIRKYDIFIEAVRDEKIKAILGMIKNEFIKQVYTVQDKLPKGPIHADFNDQNILIENETVTGIFDFGDAQSAPYIYDLAICIFYLTIECKRDKLEDWLQIGKRALEGYEKIRKLKDIEKKVLPLCILGRYLQSISAGWWMKTNDPENEYATMMKNNKYCEQQLIKLVELGINNLQDIWFGN